MLTPSDGGGVEEGGFCSCGVLAGYGDVLCAGIDVPDLIPLVSGVSGSDRRGAGGGDNDAGFGVVITGLGAVAGRGLVARRRFEFFPATRRKHIE